MGDKVQLEPTISNNGTGKYSANDLVDSPITVTGMTGKYSANDSFDTPYEDKSIIDNYQRLGTMADGSIVRNIQVVPSTDRLNMQLFLDTPEEKAAYVNKYLGDQYEVAVHPRLPSEIVLRKKGEKTWGVVDPGGKSMDELLPELLENADNIAQMAMVPAGALAGAATTGGVQGLRQVGRKFLMPELDTQVGKILIDAAGGAIAGGITGKATKAAKKSAQYAVTESGKIIKTVGEKVSQSADGGILAKIGEKLNITETPEFIAKEMGATAKQLDPTNPNLLVNKISRLQKEHPEFIPAYKSGWTLKGRYESLAKLHDEAGEAIGSFMQQNASAEVPIKDILQSKAFKDLDKASKTRFVKEGKNYARVNRKTLTQIRNTKKDFLDDLGSLVLGEAEGKDSVMGLYRSGKLVHTDLAKELGAKTNDEALIAIIGDKTVPLGDATALRFGRDQIINYGKKQGQITAKNTADKYTADAMREAIANTAMGLEGGDALIKSQNLYSDLYPVLKTMGAQLGQNARAIWNPLRTLPGVINSAPRFAAKLGINLANKMEVRAFVEGLTKGKFPLPPDVVLPKAPSKLSGFLAQATRATKYNFATGLMDQNAQAEMLPRNAELYFKEPERLNQLLNTIEGDAELSDSVVKTFERGDLDNFSNMLSIIASDNELSFDTAPYKSMVMKEGKPVIMDKYDREQYRQWVEKNILSPSEQYEILNALNFDGTMLKEPFKAPELRIKGTPRQPQEKATPLSKVSSNLKKLDTTELDDGSERVDYDH